MIKTKYASFEEMNNAIITIVKENIMGVNDMDCQNIFGERFSHLKQTHIENMMLKYNTLNLHTGEYWRFIHLDSFKEIEEKIKEYYAPFTKEDKLKEAFQRINVVGMQIRGQIENQTRYFINTKYLPIRITNTNQFEAVQAIFQILYDENISNEMKELILHKIKGEHAFTKNFTAKISDSDTILITPNPESNKNLLQFWERMQLYRKNAVFVES